MKADVKTHPAGSLSRLLRRGGDVEEQAAVWSDALRDGDASIETRRAYEAWRMADPAHASAFDDIDCAYRMARAAGGTHALSAMESEILSRVASQRRGRRRWGVAAAACLLAAVVVGVITTDASWDDVHYLQERARYALAGDRLYRTAIGERLTVSLADGSQLTLNTNSRAVVRYRDESRAVTLVRGQALFEVARVQGRPFVVTAGQSQVTALGTAFDVNISNRRLAVTLLEGQVAVSPLSSAGGRAASPEEAAATVLKPGEQFVLAAAPARVDHARETGPDPAPMVRSTNTRRAVSWREGQVIFENDLLVDAVSEINRYSRRRLVLGDERLKAMRVSGAFSTSNPGIFIDMLSLHFPVRIVESGGDRIVLIHSDG